MADAVSVKDERRRYISLNDAECRLLGIDDPADVIGKTADRLVSARRARMWREEDTSVLVSGERLVDRIEQVTDSDGTVRWLATSKTPLRNRHNAITGIVSVTRDITRNKLNDYAKDQFIATLSHELRTPVAAIMGSLSLVTSGTAGDVPETAERLLKIASTNGERLSRLVNDILDLEKISCGMMVFDLMSVDVRVIVANEIAAIQSFAASYGVPILLDEDAVHAVVRADPMRLAQVISNLLSNAVKYSPRGKPVEVAITQRRGEVRITVRDHGPGIPAAFHDSVFEKFVQVGGRTGSKNGTGLGLNIAKEIIERLHGRIGFEPADGGGTVFFATLPTLEPRADADVAVMRD